MDRCLGMGEGKGSGCDGMRWDDWLGWGFCCFDCMSEGLEVGIRGGGGRSSAILFTDGQGCSQRGLGFLPFCQPPSAEPFSSSLLSRCGRESPEFSLEREGE